MRISLIAIIRAWKRKENYHPGQLFSEPALVFHAARAAVNQLENGGVSKQPERFVLRHPLSISQIPIPSCAVMAMCSGVSWHAKF